MDKKNQDRRVIRTKRELELSLIRLLKRKSIHQISIKELSEEADITRATFYIYYRDPYDIIEQMQDKILAAIQGIINETTGGDSYTGCTQNCGDACASHGPGMEDPGQAEEASQDKRCECAFAVTRSEAIVAKHG